MVKLDNVTLLVGLVVVFLVGWGIYYFFWSKPDSNIPRTAPITPEPHMQSQPPKTGPVLVLFYGDHCPHCHSMMPAWEELKRALGGKMQIKEIESQNPEGNNYVPPRGVPTVRLYPNGDHDRNTYVEYEGDRSPNSLINFAMTGR